MLTDEQKHSRDLLVTWYDEIRWNVIQHIERDKYNYERYFEDYSKRTPEEFCQDMIKIIGDTALGEMLYSYSEDLYTYKQYLLYFTINEEYELCVDVKYCINSLFEHIKHIIDCCNPDENTKEGLRILFNALWTNLEREWTDTYGE